MNKRIQMSKEQESLYREMRTLVKRANQRLVRLERAFNFEVLSKSQLEKRLSIEPIQAWTTTRTCKSKKELYKNTNVRNNKSSKRVFITRKLFNTKSSKENKR